jgi:hypothetical protein
MKTKRVEIFILAAFTLAAVTFLISSSMSVAQDDLAGGKLTASAPACQMCHAKISPETACPMCKMCCMKMRQEHMAKMDEAVKALAVAKKAADSGDAKAAAVDIERASALLKEMQEAMQACEKAAATAAPKDGVVNARCPITGKAFDPAKVPSELTRMYKGQKVGFCCPMCPPAWDKLSDAEKDKKLQDAMKK